MTQRVICNILVLSLVAFNCLMGQSTITPFPKWAKTATIYEINIRQYSSKGDFKSVTKDLERIKKLGVKIIWLMPIYPTGITKSKGEWGSHYSVSNYKLVNPRYGSFEDFKMLVDKAHSLGLRVILDWVANHTSWDHPWIKEHPEYYVKLNDTISHPADNEGKLTDWYDVADLDFSNVNLRNEMAESMVFWVKNYKIDGFRCDVGGYVPTDFWKLAKTKLKKVNPEIYMLDEWEDNKGIFDQEGFHTNYGWAFHQLMKSIANGSKTVADLDNYMVQSRKKFPAYATQMYFVSNHDENTWNETSKKRFGDAENLMSVLAFTMEKGVPLIYNSQESNETKALKFFEKDDIEWGNYEKTSFYQKLTRLKELYSPLWNGIYGAKMDRIPSEEGVFAFKRQKGSKCVWVILNMSKESREFSIKENKIRGIDWFNDMPFELNPNDVLKMKSFEYKVIVN